MSSGGLAGASADGLGGSLRVREVARPRLRELWLPARVTLAAFAHPVRYRPMGLLVYTQAVLVAALAVPVAVARLPEQSTLVVPVAVGMAGGIVAGLLWHGVLAVTTTLGRWWWLRRGARHGVRAWLATEPSGRVRGFAVVVPQRARAGHARVVDVVAWPHRAGIGRVVMDAVCAAADTRGRVLELNATNQVIAAWHRRSGFLESTARLRGWTIPMRREPQG